MSTQPMLGSIATYDQQRFVDSIISECENGIFINSARLVDAVLRDARIFSTLTTRISGLLGKPLEFEPAEVSDGRTKSTTERYAKEIDSNWARMFGHSALVELMAWGLMQGIGIAQVIEDAEPWTIEVWHPWALTWDEFERLYWIQTRENSRLYIRPDGNGGYVDDTGTRWILFAPWGVENAPRRNLIRCLARLGNERQWSHRDRARYSEIFSQAIRLGIAPANATKEQRAEFKKALLLGAEPVVVANQGEEGNKWDLKLIEASGKSTELFDTTLTQLDREIATLLLGQSQTTDGQSGLGSNDQAGEPVRLDLMKGDNEALSTTLRNQFLVPYWQFSYGNGAAAPWPCWKVEPPENKAQKAVEFKTMIDGIVAAKAAGVPIDEREILEDFGVPMITEEEQAAIDAEKQQKALDIAKNTPTGDGAAEGMPGNGNAPAGEPAPAQ